MFKPSKAKYSILLVITTALMIGLVDDSHAMASALHLRVNTLSKTSSSQDWLGEINRYRSAAGLKPVANDPSWDAGLRHHLNYLYKTPKKYFTGQYQSLHTENPASPYYTRGGAAEASYSDLAPGGVTTPVAAVDGFLQAPFHAIGMLRPQLTQVALADNPRTGEAGLDVIHGLDYSAPAATTPTLFPGPGITTDLLTFGGESPDPLQTCGWQNLTAVGLPVIALLPQAPERDLTATFTGFHRRESSDSHTFCVVDENTYHSSDLIYGPTGLEILKSDHGVILIPRRPLTTGKYTVRIHQKGQKTIAWSFSARAAK
jgi:hypothetical protein